MPTDKKGYPASIKTEVGEFSWTDAAYIADAFLKTLKGCIEHDEPYAINSIKWIEAVLYELPTP